MENRELNTTIQPVESDPKDGSEPSHTKRWRFGIEAGLNWQFTGLMIVLLIFSVLIPLEPVLSLGWLDVAFAFVVLASVLVGGIRRRWVLVGLILVAPPLLLAIVRGIDESAPLYVYNIYFLFLALFVLIATVSILQDVLKGHHITIHSISGAISAFILIALVWTIGYTLVELNWPGSFDTPVTATWQSASGSSTEIFSTLFFYSIVTITTAGYGDVTAVSPYARSLTSLELIIGQVFLAVLVAWLVGMYIAGSMESGETKD